MINKYPKKMVPCPQPESFHSYPAATASDLSPAYIGQVPGIPPEEETLFTPPPKTLASLRASRGYTRLVCHHSEPVLNNFQTELQQIYSNLTASK